MYDCSIKLKKLFFGHFMTDFSKAMDCIISYRMSEIECKVISHETLSENESSC